MSDIGFALKETRDALVAFLVTAEQVSARWTTPPGPGRWSPSQVAEHVARALEESGRMVAGRPSKFPTMPRLVRPLLRIFYNKVLRDGRFPKVKTNAAMDPDAGPAGVSAARARLDTACGEFEAAVRAAEAAGRASFMSGAFGSLDLAGYARFQAIHIRHHQAQLTRT